jgi:vacuolar-type H+-ATPase subunit H
MSFFSRKGGSKGGSIKAPSYDPYGRFKNTGDGIFGFRKDKHIIMPGVTSYEEHRLKGVKKYVEKETGKPCTLSTELINDVYSVYVNGDVKRRPETDSNAVRHKVIDKVYDSLTKIVTVDSPLYTQILTRELALVLQAVDDEIEEEKEQKGENSDDDGDGGSGLESSLAGDKDGDGDGDGQSQDGDGDENEGEMKGNASGKEAGSGTGNRRKSLEDLIDNALSNAEQKIENAKSKADNKIKNLKDQLGEEAMKDLQQNNPEFLEEIDELKDRLARVSVNKESIRKVMTKILNESMNYFSSKFSTVEESLFECEECEDLFGLEFLHPIFKNAEIMNVGNETRKYKGKIDLYLDCSGSMDSHHNFEGTKLRMIDLVKGIAMILYRMNMIENLYFFDHGLYKINDVNEISILSFSQSGGTDFDNVINQIKKHGNNSVIITDGYDSCRKYTNQAFWIGVGGTTFQSYNSNDSAFPMYRNTRQCVAYTDKGTLEYCTDES